MCFFAATGRANVEYLLMRFPVFSCTQCLLAFLIKRIQQLGHSLLTQTSMSPTTESLFPFSSVLCSFLIRFDFNGYSPFFQTWRFWILDWCSKKKSQHIVDKQWNNEIFDMDFTFIIWNELTISLYSIWFGNVVLLNVLKEH